MGDLQSKVCKLHEQLRLAWYMKWWNQWSNWSREKKKSITIIYNSLKKAISNNTVFSLPLHKININIVSITKLNMHVRSQIANVSTRFISSNINITKMKDRNINRNIIYIQLFSSSNNFKECYHIIISSALSFHLFSYKEMESFILCDLKNKYCTVLKLEWYTIFFFWKNYEWFVFIFFFSIAWLNNFNGSYK